MGEMKTWAYAKDENGKYIKNPYKPNCLKFFSIWDVLRMRDNDVHNYNKLSFFSTASNEHRRLRLDPVQRKNSYFRYRNIGDKKINNPEGINESLVHELVIQILSEMTQIKFILYKKEYAFNFTKLETEPEIILSNGEKYYPDLLGSFTDENPYYKKWGGKVAIEVKVTNACSDEKIQDFRDHNIPIIEIDAKKFQNSHNNDEESVERLRDTLTTLYSNFIYGFILSDPVSIDYHKEKMSQLNEDKKILNNEKEKLTDNITQINKKYIKLKEMYNQTMLELNNAEKDKELLKKEISEIKSMPLLKRILFIIKG